jgi:cytochrome c peroxidase
MSLSTAASPYALAVALAVAALPAAARADELSPAARIGRQMFFDKRLSGSGRLACASCHDPGHAYAAPNGFAVQPGGADMKRAGLRAVPSLRYKETTPPYADLLDNPDGISTPGPGGGFTQDGRAGTLAEQARIPLLNPIEMANRDGAEVVAKIRRSGYADQFRAAFGERVFDHPAEAFEKATQALQAFQTEDRSFHPYSSRYDLYSGNKIGGTMSEAEKRGFAVYNDPGKGNCFACHYNGAGLNGSVALFTDFTYAAIGVPRNAEIPANRNRRYFDLGLCARPDHAGAANAQYCGEFKTPTLRNVATRQAFFHNGKMKSLAEVIRFYNTRDTEPQDWYPAAGGKTRKYDDLPARYRGNVDGQKPLDGRAPGSPPPMSAQDMADLESFLEMLTDKDVVGLIRHADGRAAAPAAAIAASAAADAADFRAAAEAVRAVLAERGDFCLGKADWPVDLSELDERARGRDAVQMPVLQALGLVRSAPATAMRVEGPGVREDDPPHPVPVRRYELTPLGESFMRDRVLAVTGSDGVERRVRRRDLCVARLSLDAVSAWEVRQDADGMRAVATYTYVAAPAPWTSDPAFRGAFPMAARVIDGSRRLALKQAFRRAGQSWVPDGLAG